MERTGIHTSHFMELCQHSPRRFTFEKTTNTSSGQLAPQTKFKFVTDEYKSPVVLLAIYRKHSISKMEFLVYKHSQYSDMNTH
jgi:hypothetical protein